MIVIITSTKLLRAHGLPGNEEKLKMPQKTWHPPQTTVCVWEDKHSGSPTPSPGYA